MSKPTVDTSQIAGFFKDPNASDVVTIAAQQLAAPVLRGQQLVADEVAMGGGLRIVMFVLDRSPSMTPAADMLVRGFNTDLVPAIKAARADDISALRLAGVSFSSDITPIWKSPEGYFHALDKLPPLTVAEYNPQDGWGTALHAAILDGTARSMAYASEVQSTMGIAPDIDVIVLSDGANNEDPRSPAKVKQMIEGADKNRVRFSFLFFQTDDGLKDPKGYAVKTLGFDGENVEVFAMRPGETAADYARRCRRLVHVMSRVSASRGTSAVAASAAVVAAPAAVDDDLV